MRTIHRVALLTVLATFVPALAACSGGFDPDKLDVFGLSEKKKLPGERKEVFLVVFRAFPKVFRRNT